MPDTFPERDESSSADRPWAPSSDDTASWRATPLPPDAERMGLSPWVAPELQFASNLRADRKWHKSIAWIGLIVALALVLAPIVALLG